MSKKRSPAYLKVPPNQKLSTREKWLLYFIGIVLFVAAAYVLYFPPKSVITKEDITGQVTELTTSSSNGTTAAIAIFSASMGIFLYGLNGLRLTRLSVSSISAESNLQDFVEDFAPKSKEDLREQLITNDDIKSAFSNIPDFTQSDVEQNLDQIRLNLLNNGITTESHLQELTSSDQVLDTLRSIYIRVLRRDRNKPLDPVAIASWGAALYKLGVNADVIKAIEASLRVSPEYQRKLAKGEIKS
ncbi:MAG: hypothetical protein CL608_04480 [Anaerolineaceae bacterium]|nr:hypothetical protein [Anaerolineaceae bacterium]